MRRSPLAAVLAAALPLVLAACGNARSIQGSAATATSECVRCHGGADNLTGAPPFDLDGRTDTSLASVGAHTAHVQAGALWVGSDCDACHVKPSSVDSPEHLVAPAAVTWGPLATLGGLSPVYDRATHQCSATYCHGGFAGGNAAAAVVWTKVGQGEAACGTCHGGPLLTPPSLPTNHFPMASGSTNATCSVCHAETVKTDGTIDVAHGKHVDGAVEVDRAAIHPAGWMDSKSSSFHGAAATAACLRCHALGAPAKVTTVTCDDCHTLIGDNLAALLSGQP